MSSNKSQNVLNLYRKMLKYAHRLSPKEREKNVTQIRTAFRAPVSEDAVDEAIIKAQSTLGYLKIVTPKRMSDGQSGVTKTIFGDATPNQGRKPVSNWTGDMYAVITIKI